MNVYIYAAELYCKECGEAIRKRLTEEGLTPEYDDFLKGPYPDGGGEADCPQHCRAGPECFNAIELSNGTKVGAWLENDLTLDGIEYVHKAIREGGEVAELWARVYWGYNL